MSYQRDFLAKKLRDPQAKFVHDIAQLQANQAADNVADISSNLKGYALKLKTKTTSKDKYYANIKPLNDDVFYTGKYPDYDNCRLFIRTENAGRLYDYSLMDSEAYGYGTRQVPDIFIKEDPNDQSKHEFVSYWNGTHYVVVKDRSILNIKSIVENETKSGFSFIRRFNPLKQGNSVQESFIIAQKTDTSQNQYGYSLNMDNEGNVYFYVKYNYRQYFVKFSSVPVQSIEANFFYENFKPQNFKTEFELIQEKLRTSIDIGCSFDFTTKECVIEVREHNSETNTWSLIGTASSIDNAIPNLQLHLPLQEGKWSDTEVTPLNEVYDSSNNNLVLDIVNPDVTGVWNEDNTFTNNGNLLGSNTHMVIPNGAYIDALSEMTWCFWAKRNDTNPDDTYHYMVNKGWANNGGFVIYHRSTSNNVICEIKTDAGVSGFVTRTNGMPVLGEWYFVTVKWKSGEAIKISINNDTFTSGTVLTGTLTNASNPTIYHGRAFQGSLLEVMFFNRQITSQEQTTLYGYGSHLSQFPENKEPQQTPQESPPPIFVPYSTIYDLPRLSVPTLNDYTFLNDPSADSPFVSNYNCADGSPSNIPFSDIYNVDDGTGGTQQEPFETVYTLAGANSTGDMQDSAGEFIYAQRVKDTSSKLYNQPITEVQCWLDEDAASGGTLFLGIAKSDGSYVKFGTGIALSALTGGWISFTKQNTSNTYQLQVGDGVAVIWENPGSGRILIRRGGTGNHAGDDDGGTAHSYQSVYDGTWQDNSDFSMSGTFKKGGGTTGSDPGISFNYTHEGNNGYGVQRIVQKVGAGDAMIAEISTEMRFKFKKTGSPTGILYIEIVSSEGGTLLKEFATLDVATLTTSYLEYVFTNLDNLTSIQSGYIIQLRWNATSDTNTVQVLTNNGVADNHNGTNSYIRIWRPWPYNWTSYTSLDLSGQIKKGGTTFTAFKQFSSTRTRIYERALTGDSSFEGEQITQVKVRGRRFGTIPSPSTIFCYIRNNSHQIVETIGSKDANSIGTTLEDIFFTNRNAQHIVNVGDYVSIEIATCNDSNYIELNINNNVADSTNSVLGEYNNSLTTNLSNYDLAGTFFTGGQIDSTSRIRVGQFINTQDSILMTAENNRVTYIELAMIKVGSPIGTFFVNIRNENDTAIKTLYSGSASALSDIVDSPTIVFVDDTTNTYNLKAKDKILIEFDNGDQNNKIGVMVRAVTPNYDGTNSYITKYDGIQYDYEESKDLCAIIKSGGYSYTPDPGSIPPNMPQLSTDIYLGVRGDKQGIYEKSFSDLFLFTTEILTSEDYDNFIITRMDIEDSLPTEPLVTAHTFIHDT